MLRSGISIPSAMPRAKRCMSKVVASFAVASALLSLIFHVPKLGCRGSKKCVRALGSGLAVWVAGCGSVRTVMSSNIA